MACSVTARCCEPRRRCLRLRNFHTTYKTTLTLFFGIEYLEASIGLCVRTCENLIGWIRWKGLLVYGCLKALGVIKLMGGITCNWLIHVLELKNVLIGQGTVRSRFPVILGMKLGEIIIFIALIDGRYGTCVQSSRPPVAAYCMYASAEFILGSTAAESQR